jgi:hypothetical protein
MEAGSMLIARRGRRNRSSPPGKPHRCADFWRTRAPTSLLADVPMHSEQSLIKQSLHARERDEPLIGCAEATGL